MRPSPGQTTDDQHRLHILNLEGIQVAKGQRFQNEARTFLNGQICDNLAVRGCSLKISMPSTQVRADLPGV